MFSFTDLNGLQVDLYLHETSYKIEPKHVLVIVKKNDSFLCAVHPLRGLEFPGGKVEQGESLEQAAIREVLEETNVKIKVSNVLGYYIVWDEVPFSKAIVIGEVEEELSASFQHETAGRKWINGKDLFEEPNLSFYMKDDGMKQIVQEVNNYEKWHDLCD